MNFFVVHDEKDEKVYNFKKNEYVKDTEVDENCFLPSISFAYKTKKYQHLFMNKPSENELKIKQVEVNEEGIKFKNLKHKEVTSNE